MLLKHVKVSDPYYKACIARVNSKERYDEYAESGFFTLVREDANKDTKREIIDLLATHFRLNLAF